MNPTEQFEWLDEILNKLADEVINLFKDPQKSWINHFAVARQAILDKIIETRIEEVERIPNPAIIDIDGMRQESILYYVTKRIQELKAQLKAGQDTSQTPATHMQSEHEDRGEK